MTFLANYYFTDEDTIDVVHNAGQDVDVNVIIDGEKRRDLLREVVIDAQDPMNKLTVYLISAQTGRIQVLSTSAVNAAIPTPLSRATLNLGRTDLPYEAEYFEGGRLVQWIGAAGFDGTNIIHPSEERVFTWQGNTLVHETVTQTDAGGVVGPTRNFEHSEEKVGNTKIHRRYEVSS